MTRSDLDPELERLGDALRAGATVDLARAADAAAADRTQPSRSAFLRRPRVLAGGTLGLAGIGTALVLTLGAGGAAAPPAFAITGHSGGSLTVNLDDPGQGLIGTNRKLAAMGTGEHIWFQMGQGPASTSGTVSCAASPAGTTVSGPAIQLTVGPGDSNTETIPAGNTGAGTWHVVACWRANGTDTSPLPDGKAGRIARRGAQVTRARVIRPVHVRHFSGSDGPVVLNLDTAGTVDADLAAMGVEEHVTFAMAQGPAPASGLVACAAGPAGATVSGPPIELTVGPGSTNTESIAAGSTGAGTWHVDSCTRLAGAEPNSPNN